MPKVTLSEGWIYGGTRYGPGEADLPDDVHKALGARGAFPPDAPAPTEAPVPAKPAGEAGGDAAAIVEAVGEERAAALAAAGFTSLAALRAAQDADLLAVPGIGEARLAALRALRGGE